MRADAGSCYTSSKVNEFLINKGATVQVAALQAPHQISIAERNHGVLLNTMRAIMYFSCAYNELRALALKYSAVLNSYMAADYKTSAPFIPWLKTGCALDVDSLYPFGCLVLVQRTKAQVDDGKLPPRAEVGAVVGWAVQMVPRQYLSSRRIVRSKYACSSRWMYPISRCAPLVIGGCCLMVRLAMRGRRRGCSERTNLNRVRCLATSRAIH